MAPPLAPADPSIPAQTQRLDILTGLRWFAALWVFVYHLQQLLAIPAPWVYPVSYGHFGVTFFFVLSGFVLTWSWNPRVKVSTFYVRRFARIWPAHVVALVLAVPVFYSFAPNPDHTWVKEFDLGILSLSLPLLQGWSLAPEVLFSGNPAAWTLTCEFFFYAIHPWIMRALSQWRVRGALVLLSSAWAASVLYVLSARVGAVGWHSWVPLPLERAPEFIVGMGVAWALRHGWRPPLRLWTGVALFGSALLVLIFASHRPGVAVMDVVTTLTAPVMTMASAVLIAGAAMTSLLGRRSWMASSLMVRLGTWSFAFYLVHASVIYPARAMLGITSGVAGAAIAIAVFAVALALSVALYRYVEHPAERAIRSWKDRRDARGTTAASARRELNSYYRR